MKLRRQSTISAVSGIFCFILAVMVASLAFLTTSNLGRILYSILSLFLIIGILLNFVRYRHYKKLNQ